MLLFQGVFEAYPGREQVKNKSFFFKLCMYTGHEQQVHFNQKR
jgi:hypothetical protein